jgi:hypothetical protein
MLDRMALGLAISFFSIYLVIVYHEVKDSCYTNQAFM